MRRTILLGVLALAVPPSTRAAVPAPVPAAVSAVVVLLGTGAQIYECMPKDAGYAWRLRAPDAVLTDVAGHRIGRHFAGPSWQAEDGSTVVGEVVAAGQAPQAGAIPWLVLRAKAHAGDGLFARVSYIVRSATRGGEAPATGCDPAHAGADMRVDYSATYSFFPG